MGLSVLLPVIGCGLQWLLWEKISPFVWFLFFPAVFFSAWLGGIAGGTVSTAVSVILVWYFFIPPELSFALKNPNHLFSVVMFLVMGAFFSLTFEMLRKANLRAEKSLYAAEIANVQLQDSNDKISLLYEKTKEIETLKSQFFANVSHELRTPLALIIGPLSKLLQNDKLDDQLRGDLAIAERNARLLHRHVNDLLDVSKLEAGRMTMRYAQTDLAYHVRMIASCFSVLAEEKAIDFIVDVEQELPAQADIEKFHRIVLNLLSNAFKFTPNRGSILISLERCSDKAVLKVMDSGPGIPEDKRDVIFEAFRQIDSASNRQQGGTGLGLSIVKEFTELHGGSVTVENSRTGGALFSVILPRRASASSMPPEGDSAFSDDASRQIVNELRSLMVQQPARPDAQAAHQATVLVVEDNLDMNAFICSILKPHYAVLSELNGKDGLQTALNKRPDLILSDVMMPGMSGDVMVEELHRHAELRDIPIMLLTAKADDALQIQMLTSGVRDYIRKPFLPDELLARVSGILNERLETRKKLLIHEEDLVETQRIAHLGSWHMDIASNQVVWSRELYKIYGFDPALPVPPYTEHQKLFTAESWNMLSAALSKAVETGIPYELELETVRKDGSSGWMWVRGETLLDDTGVVVGLRGAAQDITGRKKAEDEFRRLAAILDESQHIAQVGGWEIDINARTLYWTDETFRIHDTSPDEYTPSVESAIAFYTPDSAPVISSAVREAIEENKDFDLELKLVTAKGRHILVRTTSKIVRANEKPVKILGAIQDITEKRILEAQLLQTRKMESIGRLAGGIAHDFNNKLTVILGYVEMIKMLPCAGECACAGKLHEIYQAGLHSQEITRRLLTFSRNDIVTPRKLDLNAAITGIRTTLRRIISEHVEFNLELRKDVWPVNIDPTHLDQVVTNLVINACDAMPSGGTIVIATQNIIISGHAQDVPAGEYVQMTCSDTGGGMDTHTLEHLFEPFFTTKEVGKGTGLGLSSVYGIVKQNNGYMSVQSEQGKGSTFSIMLPRMLDSDPASAVADVIPVALQKGTILLVEDDTTVRNITKLLIETLGHTVIEAENSEQALAVCEKPDVRIDCVLTDVMMPKTNGKQLFISVRILRPDVPFIFMSGYSPDILENMVGPLDGEILQKPINYQSLTGVLAKVMKPA